MAPGSYLAAMHGHRRVDIRMIEGLDEPVEPGRDPRVEAARERIAARATVR